MTEPDKSPATRHTPTAVFRVVARFESVSLLVVLAAAGVHRFLDGPDLVYAPGMFHGIVFLVYVVMTLKVRDAQGWDLLRTAVVVILAALPLGGIWVERRLVTEPVAE